MNQQPDVRARTVKPLEENIEVNLYDLRLENEFLDTKEWKIKEKNNKFTSLKPKNFLTTVQLR